jgi:hypothetical protein
MNATTTGWHLVGRNEAHLRFTALKHVLKIGRLDPSTATLSEEWVGRSGRSPCEDGAILGVPQSHHLRHQVSVPPAQRVKLKRTRAIARSQNSF